MSKKGRNQLVFAVVAVGMAGIAYFLYRKMKKDSFETAVEENLELLENDIPEDEDAGEDAGEDTGENSEEATDDEGVISFGGEGFEIDIAPETEEDEDYIPEETDEEEVHAWHEDGAIYGDEESMDFELIGEKEFEVADLDYAKFHLTYYVQDDILVDDATMEKVDVDETIGHDVMNLLVSNPYSYVLYARYPNLGADYEVKMNPGSFADASKELDVGGTD